MVFVIFICLLDFSGKDCRDVPWNVSTRVSNDAHLIFGDVYWLWNPSGKPLPNPLLLGEGKGIIFNTGEALNLLFVW